MREKAAASDSANTVGLEMKVVLAIWKVLRATVALYPGAVAGF